jgi:lambda family phage tail tape measure protein
MIDNFGQAKTSFGDFAQAFLKDIAKMINQLLIMQPLAKAMENMFSGFGGGFFGSAHGNAFRGATGLPHGIYPPVRGGWAFPMPNGGIHAFAKGIGLLSEAGRSEAILPLTRTSGGDLGVKAQGGGTTVNIINNAGAEVRTEESKGPDGQTILNVLVERRVKELIGSGSLDRSFRSSYGLSRMALP